jgi:hypothetical protein
MRPLGIAPVSVVVLVDGLTEVEVDGGVAVVVLPDGYVVFGACAVIVLLDDVPAGAALVLGAGALIDPLGAGEVLWAVCELVEPPEAESAEPLWPLDCA